MSREATDRQRQALIQAINKKISEKHDGKSYDALGEAGGVNRLSSDTPQRQAKLKVLDALKRLLEGVAEGHLAELHTIEAFCCVDPAWNEAEQKTTRALRDQVFAFVKQYYNYLSTDNLYGIPVYRLCAANVELLKQDVGFIRRSNEGPDRVGAYHRFVRIMEDVIPAGETCYPVASFQQELIDRVVASIPSNVATWFLCRACLEGRESYIKPLISRAKPGLVVARSLYSAMCAGNSKAVSALLATKMIPSSQEVSDDLLYTAVRLERADYIEQLQVLHREASPSLKQVNDSLLYAIRSKNKACLAVLLKHYSAQLRLGDYYKLPIPGTGVRSIDRRGMHRVDYLMCQKTALHLAVDYDFLPGIELLVKAGHPLNQKDSYGRTAQQCAAQSGSVAMLAALLRAGAKTPEVRSDVARDTLKQAEKQVEQEKTRAALLVGVGLHAKRNVPADGAAAKVVRGLDEVTLQTVGDLLVGAKPKAP